MSNLVRWGTYLQWEGPWSPGDMDYELPDSPSFTDKALAVITATEGGRWNAYNAYDRCACTTGLIQWGELCAKGSVTTMLVECYRIDPAAWDVVFGGLDFTCDGTKLSKSLASMARGGSTGLRGQWTDGQKASARMFASRMVEVWRVSEFLEVQRKYTTDRVLSFAFGNGKALFTEGYDTDGWEGAFRAAYLSFAANLPGLAQDRLPKTGDARTRCKEFLRRMENTGIAIYPDRVRKIKPVIEKLFGVSFSEPTTADIQAALIRHGFDCGPTGADGVFGKRTRAAVIEFQKAHGLNADGMVGPKTLAALGL